jgi:menaquinone-specific isochorismate synthase
MRAGEYQKVVLARQTSFKSVGAIDPFLLLRRLRDINPEGFHFAIQPVHGTAFIGASPERLYRRTGDLIRSEAVAGTRRRGESMAEDRAMGDALLESEKDVREHRYVAENIREHFHRLAANFDMDPCLSLLKLSRLQHLYRGFRGRLAPGVTDAEIVRSLHPTPAVAGHPTRRAMEEIAALEPFDRGWYAGPVGWIGPGGAEFAVAIRSALVHQDRLILYAGAGIVEGSRPAAEWEELENKIAGFVRILGLP